MREARFTGRILLSTPVEKWSLTSKREPRDEIDYASATIVARATIYGAYEFSAPRLLYRCRTFPDAIDVFAFLLKHGLTPTIFTLTILLSKSLLPVDSNVEGRSGGASRRKVPGKLWRYMMREGMEPDRKALSCLTAATVFVRDAELSLYLRDRAMEDSGGLRGNPVEASQLVIGLARSRRLKDAQELMRWMDAEGIRCEEERVVSALLKVCADERAADIGRDLCERAEISGLLSTNDIVATSAIGFLATCGDVDAGARIVAGFKGAPTGMMWTALIRSCAINRRSERAKAVYDDMVRAGVKASEDAITAVLKCLSRDGDVAGTTAVMRDLEVLHGLEPTVVHHIIYVDCLSRAGKLEDAEAYSLDLPKEKMDAGILKSLLGGCKTHSNLPVALRSMRRLVALSDRNGSNLVLKEAGDLMALMLRRGGYEGESNRLRESLEGWARMRMREQACRKPNKRA
ncbi:hypothetical protein HK101_007585 [Irineochytrium annulatum]|nr:hypothetical protein HK101_007585 [Irineochytrium annulatum]